MSDKILIHRWNVLGVVGVKRDWCIMCAKNRLHEVCGPDSVAEIPITGRWAICSMCGNQVQEAEGVAPAEQVVEVDEHAGGVDDVQWIERFGQ